MRKTRVVVAVTLLATGLALLPAIAVSQPTPEPAEEIGTSRAMLMDGDTAPQTDAEREAWFKDLQAETATRPVEDVLRERNEDVYKKWAENVKNALPQHYTTDADDVTVRSRP